jgi:hypothetical protein
MERLISFVADAVIGIAVGCLSIGIILWGTLILERLV